MELAKKTCNANYIESSSNISRACWNVINRERSTNKILAHVDFNVNDLKNYFVNISGEINRSLENSGVIRTLTSLVNARVLFSK